MPKNLLPAKGINEFLFNRSVLEEKESVSHYPWRIIIESTSRCNFRCTMCGLYGDDSKGHDFDRDLFDKKVVPLLPYAEVIQLMGLGEPLLSKNFDYFYGKALKHGVRPFFVTNGSLLNEEKIRRFVQDGVTMAISLDGLTEETLARFRPEANFEKLIGTIDLVGKISREYPNSGFRFFLSCVLSRFNIHEFPKLVDCAHKWNVQKIIINELILLPQSPESIRGGQLTEQNIQENSDLLELGKQKAKNYGIELLLPKRLARETSQKFLPNCLEPVAEKKKREAHPYPGVCLSPWQEIFICQNGDVRICCNSNEVLGNLYRDDFDSIWNGEKYKTYRRTVNSTNPPQICKMCPTYTGINIGSPHYLYSDRSPSPQSNIPIPV